MQRLLGSALAGLGATLFMEYVSSWLYQAQDDRAREREEDLRQAMPTTVLVRKLAGAIGRELDDDVAGTAGVLAHYAFGAAGGPAAVIVRQLGLSPVRSGLAVAAGMEIAVDQGLNYALGLTPGPRQWPWQAHVRGGLAHVAYGLTLGLMLAAASDERSVA